MTTADPPPLHSTTTDNIPQSATLSSGERDKKLWQKIHILFHPDTYTGSVEKHTEKQWIYQENKIIKEEITFVPLMYKIFDEILVDSAAGNKQRYPQVTNIKVDFDVDHNWISVWSNTLDMDVMNASRYLSESYWGSSESSIFLTQSVIEMVDAKQYIQYKQVFTRNKRIRHISYSDNSKNSTIVSFKPDLAKFGMERLEGDTVSLMKRRVVDLAGCLGKGVKVELDGTCLPTTFEDYVKLYPKTSSIYEKVNDRLEVCVGVADGPFEQVSFVNNFATMKGGPHVDYITCQIVTYLAKIMNLEPNYIKSYLWVFVNAFIDNPAFDSETKENLTTNKGSFGSTFETSNVVSRFFSIAAAFKRNDKLEKTDGKRKWKINDPKLVDAHFAATAYSEDCTLILTQGDSAEAFARCGLSAVGQVYYGMFPLRCQLPNVKRKSLEKLKKNTEIKNIKKILGLEDGKTYENVKELRYGHLMIMADPDHAGSHFKRLLINFLHSFWPSLLKVPNFMLDFIPPIVKAFNKETNDVLLFYTMPEYEAWKEKLGNDATEYKIKYYKRLQACETKEVAEYFADLDNYTDEDDYAIEHSYLTGAGAAIDSKEKHIRYRDFINKGLILFSRADNQRSIPSVVDGFKPDQRKILFCAFRKPVIEEIGVSDLSGYVYAHSAYHHGEASLVGTIIGMAQNYVGSNNINLLQPIGLFGTRQMGGKDHASGRYLFTQLSPITRYIFHKADELLLNYLNDNGQSIEPAWFIPIVPMVLVNGSEGTGTGWSSFVPNYNPRDIIANLIRLLNGKAMVRMDPWYKCFNGAILKTEDTRYITEGLIEEINSKSALRITELPVRRWTREYKEFLKAARQGGEHKTPFIKAYTTHHDHTIEILMTEDQMTTARQEGFVKKFKLTTELSTSDMHLFDAKGVLKKYDTPEQILKEFFDLRLEFYEKRRNAELHELKMAVLLLENKVRFIHQIHNGKITPRQQTDVLCAELEKQGFNEEMEIEGKPDELYELRKKGFKEETEVEEEVAAGEEKPQGNATKTVPETEYDYLLFMEPRSWTDVKMRELQKDIDAKEKEIDVLTKATSKSLWLSDLNALDHQLQLDGNYPRMDENNFQSSQDDGKSSPEIAEGESTSKTSCNQSFSTMVEQETEAVSDSDEEEPEDDNDATEDSDFEDEE
ncbi:DNA topoisomerase 2 [Tanacetum coccineum]|uniref:DNA topoisomerase 2 n=1 Tax=Tanacetum coccineum TaxID=301880 RepID=A0ABQ5G577_9ASTR